MGGKRLYGVQRNSDAGIGILALSSRRKYCSRGSGVGVYRCLSPTDLKIRGRALAHGLNSASAVPSRQQRKANIPNRARPVSAYDRLEQDKE